MGIRFVATKSSSFKTKDKEPHFSSFTNVCDLKFHVLSLLFNFFFNILIAYKV